jgi:tetratricopeptide (TPR) repeat protein
MTAPASDTRLVAVLRERAVALHVSGRLDEAESLYRQILTGAPDDLEALTMFGVLAAQTQRLRYAAELLGRASRLNDRSPLVHNNLGIVLTERREFGAAVASFDAAVALAPQYADAWSNRGVALAGLERAAEGLASCDRAVLLKPDSALAHNNRGSLLRQLQRPAEALDARSR